MRHLLSLRPWGQEITPAAREHILNIIRTSAKPLSTKEVFRLAVREPVSGQSGRVEPTRQRLREAMARAGVPQPPHPEHPIRSVKYLKTIVLQDLLESKEVQKVRVTTTMSKEDTEERLKTMSKAQRATALRGGMQKTKESFLWAPRAPVQVQEAKAEGLPFGHEVGVGENIEHLNKRRRAMREKKVASDVRWMQKVEQARLGVHDQHALFAQRRREQAKAPAS